MLTTFYHLLILVVHSEIILKLKYFTNILKTIILYLKFLKCTYIVFFSELIPFMFLNFNKSIY